ncbi:MAG: hypothetical protein ACE5EV_08655 [Gaiellales bacterium]
MATILLSGVDLFFRGKLDAMLGATHTVVVKPESAPDLVIADIAQVDLDEIVGSYPGTPVLGFTRHTDTAGLKSARAAGFDRVVARSALTERGAAIVDELLS